MKVRFISGLDARESDGTATLMNDEGEKLLTWETKRDDCLKEAKIFMQIISAWKGTKECYAINGTTLLFVEEELKGQYGQLACGEVVFFPAKAEWQEPLSVEEVYQGSKRVWTPAT